MLPLVLVACCTSRESLMLPLVLWFSWLFIRLRVAVATGRDPTAIRGAAENSTEIRPFPDAPRSVPTVGWRLF